MQPIMSQLLLTETILLDQLARIRAAKADISGTTNAAPAKVAVKCRAQLLRDYLVNHSEGIQIQKVPEVLSALGHQSKSATPAINWLYQLPAKHAFFVISAGIVKLNRAGAADHSFDLDYAAAVTTGGKHA